MNSKDMREGIYRNVLFLRHLFQEEYGEKWGEFIMFFTCQHYEAKFKDIERKFYRILDKPSRFPQYMPKLIELGIVNE